MARVTFVKNRMFETELKGEAGVRRELSEKARAAMGVARGLTPSRVMARKYDVDGPRLQNSDAGALAIELGGMWSRAYAPMRRAAAAVGAVVKSGSG